MEKKRLSYVKIFTIFLGASIFGLIGFSLPRTINFVNNFRPEAFYGYVTSYIMVCLLFWLFFKDIPLTVKRESYFVLIKNLTEKLNKDSIKLLKKKKKRKYLSTLKAYQQKKEKRKKKK